MGLDSGVFDKASSATETSLKIEILLVASIDNVMMLFRKRITKELISLCRYIGLTAPWLFANSEDRFYRVQAQL